MNIQRIKICMISICVLGASICYSCNKNSTGMDEVLITAGESTSISGIESPKPEGQTQPTETEAGKICYVHICGEVKNPGVYELWDYQRVFQAVELAGGFTENAVTEYLNLAEIVQDGMKLVVPSVDELNSGQYTGAALGKTGTASPKVNINQASKEQLMTLKGIGESRAEDIIAFREERGRFETIEDIMKVPGIKEAAFSKIKDDITV